MNHKRWNLLPPAPDNLLNNSSYPALIAQILYNRGLTEPSGISCFIAGDKRLSFDPFLLPDIHQAVSRIYRALLSGEKIVIYGDFDADGITATAVLVQGLSSLGGNVTPYIPHRQTEGHGLTTSVLENMHQNGIRLVITVDCGITSFVQVEKAQKKGLDIIITDHHTPLPEIPSAFAIVDPKLPDSTYPFTELSGVGVAFKLLQALLQSIGKEEQLAELTDLVTIGTIADMSPLIGENRHIVKEGLRLINTSPRLGLKELMAQAGINLGTIDAGKIGWVIAPCLNSAGRLAHAVTGYDLLMTDSSDEARQLSTWMLQKNTERQKLTIAAFARAREQVIAQGISELLIASDSEYPVGVAGLVASRLSEEFYRPSIVIRTGKKTSQASCRSIPEFNIIAALNQVGHLLTEFGGHSQAAGFTLPTKNLSQLQEQLAHLATTQLDGVDLRPHLDVDAGVTLPQLGGDVFQSIQMLAPFGRGNPLPTFMSREVEVINCRTMGNTGDHLRMKLKQGGTVWNGVGFKLGNYLAEITQRIDIVYNMEKDNWGGSDNLRLNILDFAPSSLH